MTIEWIVGIFIGLLLTVAGFLMRHTLGRLETRVGDVEDDISELEKQTGGFVSFSKQADHEKAVDEKISKIYSRQNEQFELLRKDIKDLGTEIKKDVIRHMDDHLKAYHK